MQFTDTCYDGAVHKQFWQVTKENGICVWAGVVKLSVVFEAWY